MSLAARILLLSLCSACAASAEETPGKLADRVVATADPSQSYALYLPSGYTPAHSWPVVYCFDPGARGRVPVERFQEAAEKYGYILAGSNNSRNGPTELALQAIRAMWRDTHDRFSIDDRRVYAAGLSGGARVSFQIGLASDQFAGLIASAAGPPTGIDVKSIRFAVFGTTGIDDFNYPELKRLDRDLDASHAPHYLAVFEGGHEWPPAFVAVEAFEWLGAQAMRQGLRPKDDALLARVTERERKAAEFKSSKEGTAAARRDRDQESQQMRITDQLVSGADLGLLGRLRHDSNAAADSPDRRVARRVLGGAFIGCLEASRDLMQRKNYSEAISKLEVAARIRPERAQVHYDLARARALAGDRRKAIESLQAALNKGLQDRARISADPAFERLHGDARFRKLAGLE